MSARKRLAGAMAAGLVLLLTGCSGFFPPLSSGGGSGSDGGSGTGDFIYVANASAQTVAGFSVATNSNGGVTLTETSGSPYGLSFAPLSIAVTPNNGLLYVAELGGIYAYSINSSTGALTAENSGSAEAITISGSPSLDVSPDGQWLFALDSTGIQFTLNVYQINSSTGALSATANVPYTGVGGAQPVPKMVKVAPNGNYVFVALSTGGDLIYPFTTSSGTLNTTNVQTISTGSSATGDNALAVDSNAAFLYIARSGVSNGVAVYSLGSGGAPSPVSGSPFSAGTGPTSVLLDKAGKYLYVANRTDGTISGYSTSSSGKLTPLANSPYASGTGVNSLAEDNTSKYVFATASSPDLTTYTFDATTAGTLDDAGIPASTGNDPTQPIMVVATH